MQRYCALVGILIRLWCPGVFEACSISAGQQQEVYLLLGGCRTRIPCAGVLIWLIESCHEPCVHLSSCWWKSSCGDGLWWNLPADLLRQSFSICTAHSFALTGQASATPAVKHTHSDRLIPQTLASRCPVSWRDSVSPHPVAKGVAHGHRRGAQ